MQLSITKTERGFQMPEFKLEKITFESCVKTVVGGYTTYNPKASKKEVEIYRREVESWSVERMNEAVNPLGLDVKVRKNLNYTMLPLFARLVVNAIDSLIDTLGGCIECANGKVLEIGRYIKTPTSKNPKVVPYKKGRKLDN